MPERTVLCSEFDEEHKLVCDLVLGHEGPHKTNVPYIGDPIGYYERTLDEKLRKRP